MSTVHLLAISGSLRAISKNSALLEATRRLAPRDVQISIYEGLAELPHYNPDLDDLASNALPAAAVDWRARVAKADGLIISSPEYAHGIPGSLKNALDWLVSSIAVPGKPVMLLGASSMSVHAPAHLREVLSTMNLRVIDEASIVIPLAGPTPAAEAIAADPPTSAMLRVALDAFTRAIVNS